MQLKQKFQPTLPARGATVWVDKDLFRDDDFNPRSPHGERQPSRFSEYKTWRISTHAPRTGSDRIHDVHCKRFDYFNPRSPHGERRRNG